MPRRSPSCGVGPCDDREVPLQRIEQLAVDVVELVGVGVGHGVCGHRVHSRTMSDGSTYPVLTGVAGCELGVVSAEPSVTTTRWSRSRRTMARATRSPGLRIRTATTRSAASRMAWSSHLHHDVAGCEARRGGRAPVDDGEDPRAPGMRAVLGPDAERTVIGSPGRRELGRNATDRRDRGGEATLVVLRGAGKDPDHLALAVDERAALGLGRHHRVDGDHAGAQGARTVVGPTPEGGHDARCHPGSGAVGSAECQDPLADPKIAGRRELRGAGRARDLRSARAGSSGPDRPWRRRDGHRSSPRR